MLELFTGLTSMIRMSQKFNSTGNYIWNYILRLYWNYIPFISAFCTGLTFVISQILISNFILNYNYNYNITIEDNRDQ